MKNAPAQWQQAMNIIFSGLLWKQCIIYIDDLMVFSKTFEEHLMNMRACFERCRSYNLKLRPTKCDFFKNQINFLRHVVSKNGVEMDPKKVDAILKIPIPDTPAKLHSWICLAQYYRNYIRNFADEARSLRNLVVVETFEWKERHTIAFNHIKRLVIENTMLIHPIPGRKFYMETDASNWGLGYILSQDDDNGVRRVVAFGRKPLCQHNKTTLPQNENVWPLLKE
jgi:hypothetical protein